MFFLRHSLLSQTFVEYLFKRSCPEFDFLLDVSCSQIYPFVLQVLNHLNKDLLDVIWLEQETLDPRKYFFSNFSLNFGRVNFAILHVLVKSIYQAQAAVLMSIGFFLKVGENPWQFRLAEEAYQAL